MTTQIEVPLFPQQTAQGPSVRPWHRWYEKMVPASVSFEQRSVVTCLFDSASRVPRRRAVVFENGHLTYAQLADAVRRFAAALAGLGVTRGTRVAIYLPNLPQTVIAYYGALALGAEVVMTNPLYVEREITHQWKDADVRVAIVGDWLFEQKLKPIRGQLGVRHYIVTGIADFLRAPLRWVAAVKLRHDGKAAAVRPQTDVHFFKDLLRRNAPKTDLQDVDLSSVALLQYTGGTTGISKAAMLTHRNLSFNAQQVRAWFSALEEDGEVTLACLPYFHIFGMTVSLNWPVMTGGTIILMADARDISGMIRLIARHRVTIFPALPALFNGVVHHPASRNADLSSVKGCFSGSAPLPLPVLEAFEALTGGRIVEGFGLTETSPVTHCNPVSGLRKPGSIGIPLPDTEARIVDPERGTQEMPVGEVGELILAGPQVMKGYWNRPDETEKTLRNGWIYTGDLARMDEDGYFWIAGRKKDMILSSGYNVYPDEIDRVLMSHGKILEAASIGLPHPKRGETVKSFVVLKPGAAASEEQILEFCRSQLAAYKVPAAVEFRSELPKTAVQKILRRQLREEELAKSASA